MAPFSQLNLPGTISSNCSITHLPGSPLFGKKKTPNQTTFEGDIAVRGHQALLDIDWGSAQPWCYSCCSDGMDVLFFQRAGNCCGLQNHSLG